jgi:hypothetical protein
VQFRLRRVHFFFAKKRNGTKEKLALPLPKDSSAINTIGGRSDGPSMAQRSVSGVLSLRFANLVNRYGGNRRGPVTS